MKNNHLISTRDAFGEILVELGEKYKNIVVVDADNCFATRTFKFAQHFPERFINVGVAEQNMVGIAVGMAISNKIPIISSHSIFLCGRAYEQIRNAVCYGNVNVKCVGTHGGITVGHDGPTHFAVEDIAIMRAIPNMVVIVPADAVETKKAIRAAVEYTGPVFIRLGREPVPIVSELNGGFQIGKGLILREGKDVAIIACGIMVDIALEASKKLLNTGIKAAVINMHTIKPIDKNLINNFACKCNAIVVAEEHNIYGGLGGAIAESLSNSNPVVIENVGLNDTFAESGNPHELLNKYGLNVDAIISACKKAIHQQK
jgi:transketolase